MIWGHMNVMAESLTDVCEWAVLCLQLGGPQQGSFDYLGTSSNLGGLSDIFGFAQSSVYVPPQEVSSDLLK